MSYQIIQSDVIKWAETYTGPKFHAALLDPPYHLTSITKRFGKNGSAPAKGGVYRRSSAGFMGTSWDGGDLAFNPETWAALAEHLYPGAFMMAFAGTRGYHRMACAMEDSGLIIHPAIGWCQLSGFPKATRIDTQVDKAAGVEMEIVGRRPDSVVSKKWRKMEGRGDLPIGLLDIKAPATPLAQTWSTHRYGLQALKPAFEFIAVAQKSYEGRPVDNITETGAGALWIDGGRIPGKPEATRFDPSRHNHEGWRMDATGAECSERADNVNGRWPANLILDESGAEMLDRQSGDRPAGGSTKQSSSPVTKNVYGEKYISDFESYNDSGGASRMFFQTDWQYEILEQLSASDPLIYEPKVSTAEREAGLDCRNTHPTLKPIRLTKYLATLLLPPDAYSPRRILVPFAGAGSEMAGAILAGWEEVTGIEQSPDYARIAEARLAWWSQWPGWGQTDVDKILAAATEDERQLSFIPDPQQAALF